MIVVVELILLAKGIISSTPSALNTRIYDGFARIRVQKVGRVLAEHVFEISWMSIAWEESWYE